MYVSATVHRNTKRDLNETLTLARERPADDPAMSWFFLPFMVGEPPQWADDSDATVSISADATWTPGTPVEITSPPEQIVLWGRVMAVFSALAGHPLIGFAAAGLLTHRERVLRMRGQTRIAHEFDSALRLQPACKLERRCRLRPHPYGERLQSFQNHPCVERTQRGARGAQETLAGVQQQRGACGGTGAEGGARDEGRPGAAQHEAAHRLPAASDLLVRPVVIDQR